LKYEKIPLNFDTQPQNSVL